MNRVTELGDRHFPFTDREGKPGCIVAESSGYVFQLRISSREADRVIREHGYNLPFDIMAENYLSDDPDWISIGTDDLEWATGLERIRMLDSWGPLEVWIAEQDLVNFEADAAKRITDLEAYR